MNDKITLRKKRQVRIRAKVHGTHERPRLAVYRSNLALYAQLIDDNTGKTIATASKKSVNCKNATSLGLEVAQIAKKHHVKHVVFDRGGYKYHGVVKALADAVREGGIEI